MKRTIARWTGVALLLIALLPADLALARLALRHDLPGGAARAGVGAVRDGARLAARAGVTVLARGAQWIGLTTMDAACRIADLLPGRPAATRWTCGAVGGPATEAIAVRVETRCVRLAELRALERQAEIERAHSELDRTRGELDRTRARLERELPRLEARVRSERLQRAERLDARMRRMLVAGPGARTLPAPAPAPAAMPIASAPRPHPGS